MTIDDTITKLQAELEAKAAECERLELKLSSSEVQRRSVSDLYTLELERSSVLQAELAAGKEVVG